MTYDIENKISVHIGLFGHIDSGKTAVAEVLSEIISTAGIDAHPQSKERGITIDLGFTSFIVGDYLITLVDGPGHADLIKISASSVEIIDCALIVIDINKGPQIQTGEHLIMIEALKIRKVIIILNKVDLFKGNLKEEEKRIRNFFKSTSFGENIPIYPVSAKKKIGFEQLKEGIYDVIKTLKINRDVEGDLVIPVDHYFNIKGMGTILTGTILRGELRINQSIVILPLNIATRVKNIQIFHQNVDKAKAGDRVGVNLKSVDVKKLYRGCYLTSNPDAFEFCSVIEVSIAKNSLFKPEIRFGSQIHLTIGMLTVAGNIYPYEIKDEKRMKKDIITEVQNFSAILWLHDNVLINKQKSTFLISRLDLPPTTLRIMGAAELKQIFQEPPLFYRYKIKKGKILNPDHPQGIVCSGLAKSVEGAKKIIGKKLEPPFTKILDSFGTKGQVIVGIGDVSKKVNKGDLVELKELFYFQLKKFKS